jgi:hypothetical protein
MNDQWLSRILIGVVLAVAALSVMTLLEAWLAPCLAHSC